MAGSLDAARRIAATRVAGEIRFVAGIMAIMDFGNMGGAWHELKASSLCGKLTAYRHCVLGRSDP